MPYIPVRIGDKIKSVPADNIFFIDHENRRTILHLRNNNIEVSEPFAEVTKPLKHDARFLPCYRGTLVNLAHVDHMDGFDFVLTNECRVPVVMRHARKMRLAFENYRIEAGSGIEEPMRRYAWMVRALAEAALVHYSINFSKNRIVGGIKQDFGGGETVDILQMLGLSDDCRYTDFIREWRRYVHTDCLKEYDAFFDLKNLLKKCEEGTQETSLIFRSQDAHGKPLIAKQTMLLSVDVFTGEYLGFCFAHNVTREGGKTVGRFGNDDTGTDR